jgi:hypothetical protein
VLPIKFVRRVAGMVVVVSLFGYGSASGQVLSFSKSEVEGF